VYFDFVEYSTSCILTSLLRMSCVSGTRFALLVIAAFTGSLLKTADANGFLKANPSKETVSEEDVQQTLLAEVEGAFGAGSASSRVKQFEAALKPIYASLPKNEQGYLGHATVHYALHRIFVQRHGWVIKGLDSAGSHRNSTAGAKLLKEQVPSYIQDLFEKRLGNRGFGLHELAVFGATIEHLIHNEAIKRVGSTFKIHDLLPTSPLNQSMADELLDTYMTAFVHGEDLSKMTFEDAMALKAEMPDVYVAWNATQDFVRTVRRDITQSDASAEQKASGELDFSLVARVAERVSEQYGKFQDKDCHKLKADLVRMQDKGSGRVLLSDFYRPGLDGNWQFQESASYLRQLGAMDDSDANKPRVIIANYLYSQTNCIAASNFYSMCCIDECEGLLGHLEEKIAGPDATPAQIADIVSSLSSSSVASPRTLSANLLSLLEGIAQEHSGRVPLHGRLFAQWMHHAYPLECPYPHISGTTNPQSPNEWLESTGSEASATDEEMADHVKKGDEQRAGSAGEEEEEATLPWAHEEELLVVRPPQVQSAAASGFLTNVRNLALFAAMASMAYGLVHHSLSASNGKVSMGSEKLMV